MADIDESLSTEGENMLLNSPELRDPPESQSTVGSLGLSQLLTQEQNNEAIGDGDTDETGDGDDTNSYMVDPNHFDSFFELLLDEANLPKERELEFRDSYRKLKNGESKHIIYIIFF